MFTDGITAASGPDGEEFGEEQLAATAKASSDGSALALNSRLLARVADFCSSRFQDDATLLVVAVTKDVGLTQEFPESLLDRVYHN